MLHRPSRKTIFILFALLLVLLGLTAFYILVIYDPGCCVAPSPPAKLSSEVSPATPRPPFSPTSPNKMGVHLLLDDGRNQWPESVWREHLEATRQVVGEWGYVTELVRLDDLNVGRWQQFMDICTELHLMPILRLATTGNFTSSERTEFLGWAAPQLDKDGTYRSTAQKYADFVAKLEWPTDQHFIIVGNEPNHGAEWGGGLPDPAGYARFLIDVADALHTQDEYVVVMNAGFDPYAPTTRRRSLIQYGEFMDEETFLDQMVAAYPDVFQRIDAWASHSYPLGPFSQPPWEQAYQIDVIQEDSVTSPINPNHQDPPNDIFNRGVNGYEWELWKLSTYGVPPLPVMITETGWRHAETSDPNATDTGANLPDAAAVAIYFDLALNGNNGRYPEYPETGWTAWQDDPRVMGVTAFALDGYPAEWGHTNWLELDTDGKILNTYPMFDLFVPTE
ncbi:MAG: hypothetical protein HY862_08895 [Chloroflexi bacterium]|nr:hypothetical protein [Chloroflexota bacterium]